VQHNHVYLYRMVYYLSFEIYVEFSNKGKIIERHTNTLDIVLEPGLWQNTAGYEFHLWDSEEALKLRGIWNTKCPYEYVSLCCLYIPS
jgi:hypothetical protein